MGKEAVRVTPIPPLGEWVARNSGIRDLLANPDQLSALYAGVASKDFTVIRVNGELRRYCRVPEAEVFYKIEGRKYKLRETGYMINLDRLGDTERVLEEVEGGEMRGITLSRIRGNSISERSKLTGETREEATIRMVKEELFETALKRTGEDDFPDLEEIIKVNLEYGDAYVSKKGPNEKGNSFQGLPVVYFMQPASITFTPDMHVPIRVEDGVPQNLHELEEGKYINIYSWDEVDAAA